MFLFARFPLKIMKLKIKKMWICILAGLGILLTTMITRFGEDIYSYVKSKLFSEHREADVKIAKRDPKPTLRMDISFGKNDTDQPYVVIENAGPVDAVQFEFQYTILQISTVSSSTGRAAITEIGHHPKKIDIIKANKSVIFPLPIPSISWLISSLKMKSDPNGSNVLEIVISYRRDSEDLKQYASRAFYMLNPNGRIVSEYDNSLPKDVYGPIIKAAHESKPIKLLGAVKINELHPIENLDDPRKWHE